MKTQDEVDREIEALRAIKSRVAEHNYFEDDNHAAIDAQIKVLDEAMDMDEIWFEWEHDEHVRSAAESALEWMDGEEVETPSDDWKTIAK